MSAEKSKYGVFIIESMDLKNEKKNKLDGKALKGILDLCDIPNKYFYIRTKIELSQVMIEFEKSGYRFLHLACHGTENDLLLTFERIKFEELEQILGKYLYHRRLFLSACRIARFELAEYFIPQHHCYSVIGTPDNIEYDRAALFWSSFYYLIYELDCEGMNQKLILPTLKNVSQVFKVELCYFSIINDRHRQSIDHLKEFHIKNGLMVNEPLRKTRYKNLHR